MHVFQRLNDAEGRRGYEWRFDDILLVGIQRWAARLTVTLASDSPAGAIQLRTRERFRYGDWHHVALTYDGSGKAAGARVYVDGEPASVDVVRDTLAGPMATDAPLTIGRRSLGQPFLGQIDDLRLYGRVLEPGQIANLAVHYPVRLVLSGVFGKRTTAEAAEIRDYFLTHAAPQALRTANTERGACDIQLDVAPHHAPERASGVPECALHDVQQAGQRALRRILLAQRHQRQTRLFAQLHEAAVGQLNNQPAAPAGLDDIRFRKRHAGARRQTLAGMLHPRRHLQAIDLRSAAGERGKKKRGGNSEKQNRTAHEKLPFFCYSQLCTAKNRVVQARRRQKLCNC
jgi:hypothetical protein